MTYVGRLKGIGAFLAVAAVLTNAHVWGESVKKSTPAQRDAVGRHVADKADQTLEEDLASSKFTQGGTVTYHTTTGDLLFALQVKPKLEASADRPRDYLVMVDTSASQAKGPLAQAQELTDAVASGLRPNDRMAIWTANTPAATRNLTSGFRGAKSEQIRRALDELRQEIPLGDTDLKDGLAKAIATFERTPDRQQVLILLGDGMSVHNPMTAQDRARLSEDMAKSAIVFYPVPLGPKLDPQNLHGLATGTGGLVIRWLGGEKVATVLKRFNDALAAPILYPKSFRLSNEVAEAFPTVLPPVRGDAPTLVAGRLKSSDPKIDDTISYTLEGTVAGRDVQIQGSQPIGTAEPDNFFLVGMVEQWKNAKDQPALTRADRALAYALQRSQMARADLIAQAEWALSDALSRKTLAQDKLDAASQLFGRAKKLDPADLEADAGLKVVEKLKKGLLKKEQLEKQLSDKNKSGLLALAQAAEKAPPPAPIAPPVQPEDLLQEQKRRVAVEEQRSAQLVSEAEQRARQLLPTDPDAAHDLLKRTYESVRGNPDLTDRTRDLFISRLETSLRSVDLQGVRIKRNKEEQLRLLADSMRRLDLDRARTVEEQRTARRMLQFTNLMNQARYEDAYLQALAIQTDAINTGRGVPPSATAAYEVGLAANNLSQIQELRRTREERYLLTMMQCERSHIPFPDEPPIQFPPASVWRELTRLRKDRYESSGLTEDDPTTTRKIRELRDKLSKPVTLDRGIEANTKLQDAIDFLQDRYDITILVDSEAFKSDLQVDNIGEQPISLPKLRDVSLATVLRLLAAKVGGTYLIRRDYIEFTTPNRAVAEKVIRVYPVADLVIPIPNSINLRSVNQLLTILGTGPGIGLQLGSPLALGGLGAAGLGGLGGLGALGVGGLAGALGLGGIGGIGGIGGLAGLGGGLGALGVAGGGLAGLGGGLAGGLGIQGGGVNLGVGGGALGFGGGQLGQFGNLGGQFGLQGGDQSAILVQLIRQVVGTQKEWQIPGTLTGGLRSPANNPAGAGPGPDDEEEQKNPAELLNSLGYYPPARALVVKGSSRIHTNLGGGLLSTGRLGPPQAALDRKGDNVAQGPKNNANAPGAGGGQVASAAQRAGKPGDNNGNRLPANGLPGDPAGTQVADAGPKKQTIDYSQKDPKKIWQEALAKGISDPGLIIAVADFLAANKQYGHVAEFLKANLRLGIVVRPWVYEALALALEQSGGSPDEIERARLSAVDLEPQGAPGYVRASKAMADLKRFDRAVAFCRQAALLEPNSPEAYEEALIYAELAKDSSGMEWAAGSLLRQEWPIDNDTLHLKAKDKLKNLAQSLEHSGRKADAQRMVDSVSRVRERDLVIVASWQGESDVDLSVEEPIGTTCSFLQRQTAGGGILLGDNLSDSTRESYVAAKAFTGEYKITLRRIWGRPLGGKVTLDIIQHQGTPQESRRRETVVFDRSRTLNVVLDEGRRTSAENVPPPQAEEQRHKSVEPQSSDSVLTKMRNLADPEFTGGESGLRGGLAALGVQVPGRDASRATAHAPVDTTQYQAKVTPVVSNGADFTVQQTPSGVKLAPIFQSVHQAPLPSVSNPLIPGGGGSEP